MIHFLHKTYYCFVKKQAGLFFISPSLHYLCCTNLIINPNEEILLSNRTFGFDFVSSLPEGTGQIRQPHRFNRNV